MDIKYINDDLFKHLPEDNFIIPHIVNSIGKWGSGFVIPLGQKFPKAREEYLNFHRSKEYTLTYDAKDHIVMEDIIFELGATQIVQIDNFKFVANMVSQEGVVGPDNPTPIKYDALNSCMNYIKDFCLNLKNPIKIYAPKFGSDRARGDWNIIEKMIKDIWIKNNIETTIFYI